ncbi:MAG TPA: acetyl-CoA carboxylase carboxyltransferase subunit alpha, partial [Planctomycetota bacterium]|nr:acetyl-CoA carboxylase carboxyltransferase subunit alpha [Planctomycetota bacterium]
MARSKNEADDSRKRGSERKVEAEERSSTPIMDAALAFERPILEMEHKIQELKALADSTKLNLNGEGVALEARLRKVTGEVYDNLTPWERVRVSRHPQRPVTQDYINGIFEDFLELHGDRSFGDDRAIVTGFATIEARRILLVGHRKGKSVKDRLLCNFGCAHPEGYRKALEKMRLAEKLGLPIVCLVDTQGAYPGIGAEERGQARAIALNIREMFSLRVPIIAIVIGEGGSGGALGIGVGDRVAILKNAYYSVITPEGCAAILWKSADKAPEAAAALRLSAPDLFELGIVDELIDEPLGGAHRRP